MLKNIFTDDAGKRSSPIQKIIYLYPFNIKNEYNMKFNTLALLALLSLGAVSCKEKTVSDQENSAVTQTKSGNLTTDELKTEINGITHRSYAAYNADLEGPLPVVFVLPEWWGLNDSVKDRDHKLAELGYYAGGKD